MEGRSNTGESDMGQPYPIEQVQSEQPVQMAQDLQEQPVQMAQDLQEQPVQMAQDLPEPEQPVLPELQSNQFYQEQSQRKTFYQILFSRRRGQILQ